MAERPKVLIIDDSPTVRVFMARVLDQAGYNVSIASDGREGWRKTLHEQPRCLILDIVLPDVSGFQICRRLRANVSRKYLSIILVSTKDTPLDQSWGLRQGADRYLIKPFSNEVLIHTVQEVLAQQQYQ